MSDLKFGIFGLNEGPLSNPNSTIVQLIRIQPKCTYVEAANLMLQAYDTDYAIFNHVQEEAKLDNPEMDKLQYRPLSSVALHPAEDLSGEYSARKTMARQFADMKMGTLFNIAFDDFLNLPVNIVEELFTVAREYNQIALAADADQVKKLNETMAGMNTKK